MAALPATAASPHPASCDGPSRSTGASPERSWVIGDILDDVEAGTRAGCLTALVDNGNETVWRRSPSRTPDVRAATLDEVARLITTTSRKAVEALPVAWT